MAIKVSRDSDRRTPDPALELVVTRIENANSPAETLGHRNSQTADEMSNQYFREFNSLINSLIAAQQKGPDSGFTAHRINAVIAKLNAAHAVFDSAAGSGSSDVKSATDTFKLRYGAGSASAGSASPDGALQRAQFGQLTREGTVLTVADHSMQTKATQNVPAQNHGPSKPKWWQAVATGIGVVLFSRGMDWTGARSVLPIIFDTRDPIQSIPQHFNDAIKKQIEDHLRAKANNRWGMGKLYNSIAGRMYPDLMDTPARSSETANKFLEDGHEFGKRLKDVIFVVAPTVLAYFIAPTVVNYFLGSGTMDGRLGVVCLGVAGVAWLLGATHRYKYEGESRVAEINRARRGWEHLREHLPP